jgi:GNAT superfamily N-acetyltransferase
MLQDRFTIRKATFEDTASILHCLHTAFAPYRDLYSPQAFVDTTLTGETILERMRSQTVLVAVSAGTVIGTVGGNLVSEGEEGHIRGMAVVPEWHGKGVAQALLGKIEQELRQQGCRRITLDTTAPLKPAIRFYEKNGYTATNKVSNFFGMPLYEYQKRL